MSYLIFECRVELIRMFPLLLLQLKRYIDSVYTADIVVSLQASHYEVTLKLEHFQKLSLPAFFALFVLHYLLHVFVNVCDSATKTGSCENLVELRLLQTILCHNFSRYCLLNQSVDL